MSISREVLAKYVKPGYTFIETGTRWGDTCIRAIEAGAHEAWTCDADKLIAGIAQLHCDDLCGEVIHVKKMPSVPFLRNSGLELWADHSNTVVFLDAHTDSYSPVLEELYVILNEWKSKPRTILIDDLCYMDGWGITLSALGDTLAKHGYTITLEVGRVAADIMAGTR